MIARDLVAKNQFLKVDGRVLIFASSDAEGFKLAGENIPKTHAKAITTLKCLYEMSQSLAWGCPDSVVSQINHNAKLRPPEEDLQKSFEIINHRIEDLFKSCGNVIDKCKDVSDIKKIRAPKGDESSGHAFLRPKIQREVADACGTALHHQISWQTILERLSTLQWNLSEFPWKVITKVDDDKKLKMNIHRDEEAALKSILRAVLCPQNKQQIKEAFKKYKDITKDEVNTSEYESRIKS